MEQHYKSFMDKQHPSDFLIKDTIQKAENLSQKPVKTTRAKLCKWQFAVAAAAVFCLLAGGVWKWNSQIVYTDLNTITVTDNPETQYNQEYVGEIKQSYLGNNEAFSYLFDKNAETSEIQTEHGNISVQVGSVLNAGIQALYETKPNQIKGFKVYLGKFRTGNDDILLAAFVKNDKQYYLEGQGVTEEEMTTAVKDLLK